MSFHDKMSLPTAFSVADEGDSQIQLLHMTNVSQSSEDIHSKKTPSDANTPIYETDSPTSQYSLSTVKLSKLAYNAMAICLGNTIDKLIINNTILQLNEVNSWNKPFTYDSIEQRINDIKKTQTSLPESVRDPLLNLTNLQKLKRDVTMIVRTYKSLLKQIEHFEPLQELFNVVELIKRFNQDEYDLIYECNRNIKLVQQLISDIRNETRKGNENVKQLNAQIENLDNIVHDAGVTVNLTLRFTNKWDLNRYNQNRLRLQIEEQTLQKEINEGKVFMENENRVHDEIKKYLTLNQTMNLEKIEERMTMYDQDTEQSDLDFKKLLADQAIQHKNYKEMKKEFRRRKIEMAAWIQDKTMREETERHTCLINSAATKIQACFRGYLVRHAIGPYKYLKALMRKAAAAMKKASKAAKKQVKKSKE